MSTQKKMAVLRVLDTGIVMIHCDPRHEGVSLPDFLKADPIVRLNFAYGFQLPSFEVDDEAISAVLNFNGQQRFCVIPWDSVFAITAPEKEHRGWFWRESAPREALLEFFTDAEEGEEKSEEADPLLPAVRPQLRLVDSVETEIQELVKDIEHAVEQVGIPEPALETAGIPEPALETVEFPEEPEDPPSGGPQLRLVK